MLSVRDLIVAYGRLLAVKGVSFDVAEGEILCVAGANGAGKSSLVRALAGIVANTRGNVHFLGEPARFTAPEEAVRRGLALVPEGRHIFAGMTVEENLKVAMAAARKAARLVTLDDIFALFPALAESAHLRAGNLSGGQQQQLAIGRCLLSAPRLMMVDEPSLGLAPKMIDVVYQVLLRLRREQGLTLLVVEQAAERALKYADTLMVLRNGSVTLRGRPREICGSIELHAAYFGKPDSGPSLA
jgi:branched-chain amino acid transport system ATP-binding protein